MQSTKTLQVRSPSYKLYNIGANTSKNMKLFSSRSEDQFKKIKNRLQLNNRDNS